MKRPPAMVVTTVISIVALAWLPFADMPVMAQSAPVPGPQQLLTPDQLDNLVAPIALYPDPLLSQVLAASTYPLEVVEAQQWLQQNPNLRGSQLLDAAKEQNWDPSVQALVTFPDALDLLNRDIRWTTDLGNVFLAQQSDVMAAVQRMRARAEANGKLTTTPQEVVTTATEGGASAIEIQPADPQVIYVPVYNPVYVWGPPVWDPWPLVWYPGYSVGFGFGAPCYLDSFFAGFGGWGGWGWGFNWFGGGLFVNTGFFQHYGFHDFGGYGHGFDRGYRNGFGQGRLAWAHDPSQRQGIPYGNRSVSNRFASGGSRFTSARFSATRQDASRYNNGGSFATRFNSTGTRGSSNGAGTRGNFNGTGTRGNFNGAQTGRFNSPGNSGGSRFNAGSRQGQFTARGGSLGTSSNGWRSFSATGRSSGNLRVPALSGRSYNSQAYRGRSSNYRTPSQSYRAPSQGYQSYRAPSNSYSARSFSAPRAPGFSNFSGSRFSAPQSRSFSAPRYYSAPPSRSFSAPRSYSAPQSRSFSGGGRSFGGGSHSFGGGRSFSGGGRSFGGGGRSRGGGGGNSSRGGRR
jgi:hypothetical protein